LACTFDSPNAGLGNPAYKANAIRLAGCVTTRGDPPLDGGGIGTLRSLGWGFDAPLPAEAGVPAAVSRCASWYHK